MHDAARMRLAERFADLAVTQRGGFLLDFLEPVFDHVADRHHADHLFVLDHRQVAELARGHQLHQNPDGIRLAAGDDLARHHLSQRLREHACAALGQHAYDVAL